MFDQLSLSDYLALMIGLYLFAAGVGLFMEGAAYKEAIAAFKDNVAIGYLAAILAFASGVVLIRLHNDWEGWRAIVLSLVGWAALIEGVLMLAFRRQFIEFFLKLNIYSPKVIGGISLCCLLFGLMLMSTVVL